MSNTIFCLTVYYVHCISLQTEFMTGEDHTTEVHDIEKNLIGYQNSPVSVHCTCICVYESEGERRRGREKRREKGSE